MRTNSNPTSESSNNQMPPNIARLAQEMQNNFVLNTISRINRSQKLKNAKNNSKNAKVKANATIKRLKIQKARNASEKAKRKNPKSNVFKPISYNNNNNNK